MKIRYYKIGQTWVVSCKFKALGLIHLGSPFWWKPIATFPLALYKHLKLAWA